MPARRRLAPPLAALLAAALAGLLALHAGRAPAAPRVIAGVDPAPQDVSFEQSLLSGRRVRAFLYNNQVTDSLTSSFLADAERAHIPVVGIDETMPPGRHYQSWMLAELAALERAVTSGRSTLRP